MADSQSYASVFWKCSTGSSKDQCDFRNVGLNLDELDIEDPLSFAPNGGDACNKFPDCHSCITAREGDIRCGWCQGGNLTYEDVGLTKFKCGGYTTGQPHNFTCPASFKTVDCEGWTCNWSNNTCFKSGDDGQYLDNATCAE